MVRIGQVNRPFGHRIMKALPGIRKFIGDFSRGFKTGFDKTIDTLSPFVKMIPGIGEETMQIVQPIRGAVDAIADIGSAADQRMSAQQFADMVKQSFDPLKAGASQVKELGKMVSRS